MDGVFGRGGAGFVGSHLCDALLEKGNKVICIDNLDTGSLQNIEHITNPDFTFLPQDITEEVLQKAKLANKFIELSMNVQ